jgi:hypothetical protein
MQRVSPNPTPLERQLEGPRRYMTDSLMISARMTADIDTLAAAHGYVTVVDMIRLGWTLAQVESWRFKPQEAA